MKHKGSKFSNHENVGQRTIERNPQTFGHIPTMMAAFEALIAYRKQYNITRSISIDVALEVLYQAIENRLATETLEVKPSCKKGCSACCHIEILIYADEAAYIAKKCKENGIAIPKTYLQQQLKIPPLELPLSQQSACVFLKNGECSIYKWRPLSCRKYFVASDPALCDPKIGHKEIAILSSMDIEALAYSPDPDKQRFARMQEMLLPYSK